MGHERERERLCSDMCAVCCCRTLFRRRSRVHKHIICVVVYMCMCDVSLRCRAHRYRSAGEHSSWSEAGACSTHIRQNQRHHSNSDEAAKDREKQRIFTIDSCVYVCAADRSCDITAHIFLSFFLLPLKSVRARDSVVLFSLRIDYN